VRRIIYLINPIAGTRNKNSLPELISSRTKEKGIEFEIVSTVASGDYEFLKEKIRKEKITDVVVCGGDGSINQAVYPLVNTGARFGVIPLGSGNGLALAAKISRDTNKALDTIFAGHSKKIDGFLVNNQFACMLCGLGFDATVAHEFAKKGKRGLMNYAKITATNLFHSHTYKFEIEANDHRFSSDAYFISVANSNQFGNNFTIAPEAKLSDGLLDVVIVQKSTKPLLLWNVMMQVWRGRVRPMENSATGTQPERSRRAVKYFQTDKITIKNQDLAPMHIDGEPKDTPSELNIKVLPSFFELIQPL
jgi:YegS/Rv2252/BmrU family lipid kinase